MGLAKILLTGVAWALAVKFAIGAYRVWTKPAIHSDSPAERFFERYFRRFWGAMGAFWAVTCFAIGRAVWEGWDAVGRLLLLFPASFAVGLIVSWTYMPWAYLRTPGVTGRVRSFREAARARRRRR